MQVAANKINRQDAEARGLIGKMTNAIYDREFTQALKAIPWSEWMMTRNVLRCRPEFLSEYDRWIRSSRLNRIRGLDRFAHRDLINGTTQTFDEAYFKYASRRLRVFRGEYAYHRRVDVRWAFLEDEPLLDSDYVIVSAPFCSTGTVHPRFYELLEEARELSVPVIVDCAYFGTCENLDLDVSGEAIESVSFSHSKGLGLGDIRCGIRYSNIEDMNPIRQQNHYDHTVLCAARIGLHMMQALGPDHIPLKYSRIQKQVCAELGLTATPCMHLALSDSPDWDEYMVDEAFRRVGIRNLVRARFHGEA